MKNTKFKVLPILVLIAFLVCIYLFIGRPMVEFVSDVESFQSYIDGKGVAGILIFGLLILFQTITTCIPGLPFYLAAGYVWGGVKGALICDLFATLANTVAFLIGKKFGRNFLLQIFPEDKLEYVEGFIKKGNPKFIHAMFMFLPLPKDTYAWLGYYSEENVLDLDGLAHVLAEVLNIFGGNVRSGNEGADAALHLGDQAALDDFLHHCLKGLT